MDSRNTCCFPAAGWWPGWVWTIWSWWKRLTDLLHRLASSQGPIRQADAPALRFEWRPMVLPAGLDHLTADLTLDDKPRTALVYLRFQPLAQWGKAVTVGKLVDAMHSADDDLARAEAISAGIVTHIERIVERMNNEERA
ncbi:MAG: hypothetical protein R3E70_06460 [Burkholderiaceae bacterium]